MHFLLIEDDLDLGPSLLSVLRQEGYSSEWVRTVADGVAFASCRSFDMLILDVALPDGSGLDALRQLRSSGNKTPIIILTASAELGDRLTGLDQGADDFMLKPFVVAELLSRIRAVTRRAAQQASAVWSFGDLQIDIAQRHVQIGGAGIRLAPREYDLLLALARSPGKVVPKHRLAMQLAPLGEPLDLNAVEVHVYQLRLKIGAARIGTVRGVGYLLKA